MAVYVAGVGRTRYGADERSIPEMVYEAVASALRDAALDWDEIDYIVTASLDLLDGKVASSVLITEVVGAVMKEEARVADDGAAAFFHAAAAVLSGRMKNVLVVAHAKNTESDPGALGEWSVDPVFMQPLSVDDLRAAALQADRWLAEGGREERMDRVAAIRHGTDVSSVRASAFRCEPLRELHCAPLADGACALVLTGDEGRGKGHARVAGLGLCVEPHYLGDRDLIGCAAARTAAERAFRMAGWGPTAIEQAEISAPFAHQEILWAGAFGLTGPDDPGGSLRRPAINPTGGWFAGNPYVVSGLERVVCASEAIRAGRAARALGHGCWGAAGQGHCVVLFEAAP